MTALSEREQQILAFEKGVWLHAGAKESAILDLFGCTATRYYQERNALLDRPEAYAHDPVLVKRLRRLRDHQRAVREGRASSEGLRVPMPVRLP